MITKDAAGESAPAKKGLQAHHARHPDAVKRSAGSLVPDVEWYVQQQILPPIARLCEPIAGTSSADIARHLGLDVSDWHHQEAEDTGLRAGHTRWL